MVMRRTNSYQIGRSDLNNTLENFNQNRNTQSGYGLSSLFASRMKMSNFMQQTLKLSRGGNPIRDSAQGSLKKSKLASMMRSSLKEMLNLGSCDICEMELNKSDTQLWMCNCDHKFKYCESCLHHYVIYKVKIFEEVRCPHEECPTILDTTSNLFSQLPLDIQKRYNQLHRFYEAAKESDVRLCPKEDCEGLIKKALENVMVCDKCGSHFCGKCLLAKHEGECDKREVEFFQSNLHYRQCAKCKFIIQKNQGCNHMTCKCGYQFCYVCGAVWSGEHYNIHDNNGLPILPENSNDPACNCVCCNQRCGDTLATIFKFPLKFFLVILFIILIVLVICLRDTLVILGITIITVFAGLFGFSLEILSGLKHGYFALGVIFFPFLMILGIGVAIKQIFCDIVPGFCRSTWVRFRDGMTSICRI